MTRSMVGGEASTGGDRTAPAAGDAGGPSGFDWRVYADATCAGLSALVPVPFLDLAFERFFRRRIPAAIGRARRVEMARLAELGLARRERAGGRLAGCLGLPVAAGRYLVKRLWRKVVYVLAVADAAELVSEYWHRAYLIDHILRAGHAAPGTDIERMLATFHRTLNESDTSPLRGLARRVIRRSRHVVGLLVRARRRGAVGETTGLADALGSEWQGVEASLLRVALRYNRAYPAANQGDDGLRGVNVVEEQGMTSRC